MFMMVVVFMLVNMVVRVWVWCWGGMRLVVSDEVIGLMVVVFRVVSIW